MVWPNIAEKKEVCPTPEELGWRADKLQYLEALSCKRAED